MESAGAAKPPATDGLPIGPPDQLPGGEDVGPPPERGVSGHEPGHQKEIPLAGVGEAGDLPERGGKHLNPSGEGFNHGTGRGHSGHRPRGGDDDGLPLAGEDGDGVGGEVDDGHRSLRAGAGRRDCREPLDTYQDREIPALGRVGPGKKTERKNPAG